MNPPLELRVARRAAGLSQAALAARAGTSQAAVSAYESGAKEPSVATLGRLLEACGARLSVAPAGPARAPTAAEHAATARRLADVLALAAALPVRHAARLEFPRLA